jgi:prepilin-type processing-associated H-X9-DG protein
MQTEASLEKRRREGFTLVELIAIAGVLTLLISALAPALGRTRSGSEGFRCLNNNRALIQAWAQQAGDNGEVLLGSLLMPNRELWMAGAVDFNPGNRSNTDTNQDLVKSPLWAYTTKRSDMVRCPADKSTLKIQGVLYPRLRSISMSSAFAWGDFLDRTYSGPAQSKWRVYDRMPAIINPLHTYVFVDEHPDSLNDSQFVNACTGNEEGDMPQTSTLVAYPSNLHNGGATFSFADGHVEIHPWVGAKLKNFPVYYNGSVTFNVPSESSTADMHWLAANTTVRR